MCNNKNCERLTAEPYCSEKCKGQAVAVELATKGAIGHLLSEEPFRASASVDVDTAVGLFLLYLRKTGYELAPKP